ncbi:hypothetical protein AOQ84DRAFT_393779 [Glonium stellatum]|uniref:Uncharacterized protein n=1 Tax=Glonium stellatum TaxID=574774 RepID=A0A8E2EN47_9PEZI|nr:hypothetical protein AOQ84DRAFT_393779 [Glonium stellatum]
MECMDGVPGGGEQGSEGARESGPARRETRDIALPPWEGNGDWGGREGKGREHNGVTIEGTRSSEMDGVERRGFEASGSRRRDSPPPPPPQPPPPSPPHAALRCAFLLGSMFF